MLDEQKCQEQDREDETNTPIIRNTRNVVEVRMDAKEEKVKACLRLVVRISGVKSTNLIL